MIFGDEGSTIFSLITVFSTASPFISTTSLTTSLTPFVPSDLTFVVPSVRVESATHYSALYIDRFTLS